LSHEEQIMPNDSASIRRLLRRSTVIAAACWTVLMCAAPNALAEERVYFSAIENVTDVLVQRINAENVRIDISSWYLSEHAISIAIANRFAAGVPVRLMGDRGAIFEADPHTKAEFYWLANQGVPIRLRFNPTWFPEINHWKMALFVGQGIVEFGSGNFAPTELAPVSSTNYSDETELFTDDPALVAAFKTKFDVMWNDTTLEPQSIIGPPPYFKDWNDACANEPTGNCADYHTLYPNPAPMNINTARLEGDNPTPPGLIWGQGPDFNNRIVQEINNEFSRIDLIVYRLEVDNITNAILAKFNAGVPVRLIVDPGQYTNIIWPEYWLTHANLDKLWAAGVPIKQAVHQGVTHMKTLVTSTYATNGSSNFGPNWQRDHDYFVSAATKPAIYQAIADRVNAMWNDTVGFGPLQLTPPNAANLASPPSGSAGVAATTSIVWNRAAWAVSYDIYVGTTQSNMTKVANVPAQLVLNPPDTYSWTPPSAFQSGTTYFWKVVSRTNATPLAPNMIATSNTWSFTTAGTTGPPPAPSSPAPANNATGVSTASVLGWSAGAAGTTYNVAFGTTNPPPAAASGLGTSSYSPGTLAANTTYFWRVTAVSSGGSTAGPIWTFTTGASGGGLPAPWQNQDVGSTGLAGSASFSSGTFSVRGAGADIWGGSDSFQYVYQTVSGDGEIVARVTGITNTNTYAKAGVMWRESGAANAAHVILDIRPTGDVEFMSRAATGGDTSYIGGASQVTWLKLTRAGSTFTGYVSTNGSTWTAVASTSATIASNARAGLVVTSHDTSQLNTATFANVSVATAVAPGAPGSPSPANGATGVAATPTLTWTASGATSYDVKFGTTNPPASVSSNQPAASYTPATLANNTQYFWQIVARNASGTTAGPVWSFTTAAAPTPPSTPASPSPANNATGVSTTPTLTWASSGATSYDVKFGTTNPPPVVSSSQPGASYSPSTLLTSKKYFWQIVARNGAGTTSGPVWSFTTAAAASNPEIVIYASDIPAGNLHGLWSVASDATSPNGVKLATADTGFASTDVPVASPAHYVEVTFTANAGIPFRLWLRFRAVANSKYNDSLWVQFSDALSGGSPIYPIGTTSGLDVNLATDSAAGSLNGWGWQNTAYWLSQPTTVTFATSGSHTMRIQLREDGVELDQIVLSSSQFLSAPPGGVTNDSTIVPKP
jgi:PLD-like domain